MPHDVRDDYADAPGDPYGLIDRLFLGIQPIHFILLVFVPCWWPLAPGSLGWAAVGLLVGRHPGARRNAVILLIIATIQLIPQILYVLLAAFARRV